MPLMKRYHPKHGSLPLRLSLLAVAMIIMVTSLMLSGASGFARQHAPALSSSSGAFLNRRKFIPLPPQRSTSPTSLQSLATPSLAELPRNTTDMTLSSTDPQPRKPKSKLRRILLYWFPTTLRRRRPSLFASTTSTTETTSTKKRASRQQQVQIVDELTQENVRLRAALDQTMAENERLHREASRLLGLETFEGEFKWRRHAPPQDDWQSTTAESMTLEGDARMMQQDEIDELWCDTLGEEGCPIEPTISFGEALRDRAYWLVGLLVLQSGSGLILAANEALLAHHPVIIYFLTMLVGAGGNAGNQASVRVIRGLALGTLNASTQNQFLVREFKMAVALSCILSVTGFCRALAVHTPLAETIAVTTALAMIVFTSICLGAVLPLLLKKVGVDPAHSSTTIQVVMDILGVLLAVGVSSLLLDSPLGHLIVMRLLGGK